MDTQRLILLFIFGFSLLMLWDAWEKENRPKPAAEKQQAVPSAAAPAKPSATPAAPAAVPTAPSAVPTAPSAPRPAEPAVPTTAPAARGETITVQTDVLIAEIDTLGATLKRVELLKHRDSRDASKNQVLLGPEHQYEAQSGLAGESGPNHNTPWSATPVRPALEAGQNPLEVRLEGRGKDGVVVQKVYRFKRDSYLIDVDLEIQNGGTAPVQPAAYFQTKHNGKRSTDANTIAESFGAQSFHGFAVFSDEKKFEKIELPDVDKGKASYLKQSNNGWLAYVEHYFVSGWFPPAKADRSYDVVKVGDAYYGRLRLALGTLAPGAATKISVPFYAGPQEQRRLDAVAPGFDYVVDYGWLAIIAWPLFWLLEKFHTLSGNWGVAIILLTVLIKLVFFPLSAASYKSMAKMKLITPRLQRIREMYEHDRQRMNQAMMELYRTEKINPLGGCFPILVQIPVFIALYWVLLAAIELRHAPFVLWIKDLSALDPYYVLPILMTVTMILQTKMNPVPPDPVQAKVMQFMPYIFSIFFFFFPAGLVLYWLVNNILSIAQQWQIQRMFDRDKPAHAKR
jgi:YidC/Oxa1 family membrane protein insertase